MKEIKNQEQANKAIADHLEEVNKLIKKCEKLADKFGCYFDFRLVYGAGATYIPERSNAAVDRESGWQASSQSGC